MLAVCCNGSAMNVDHSVGGSLFPGRYGGYLSGCHNLIFTIYSKQTTKKSSFHVPNSSYVQLLVNTLFLRPVRCGLTDFFSFSFKFL